MTNSVVGIHGRRLKDNTKEYLVEWDRGSKRVKTWEKEGQFTLEPHIKEYDSVLDGIITRIPAVIKAPNRSKLRIQFEEGSNKPVFYLDNKIATGSSLTRSEKEFVLDDLESLFYSTFAKKMREK